MSAIFEHLLNKKTVLFDILDNIRTIVRICFAEKVENWTSLHDIALNIIYQRFFAGLFNGGNRIL